MALKKKRKISSSSDEDDYTMKSVRSLSEIENTPINKKRKIMKSRKTLNFVDDSDEFSF